jgi:hypothetical protein
MADESYTGEAYCVKCKEKREFTGVVVEKNSLEAGAPPDAAVLENNVLTRTPL